MNVMKFDSRLIGPGKPTLIVAEIGVNHDGSLNKALELVRIASIAGADAVKLQIFRTTSLMHPSSKMAEYQKDRSGSLDPIEMLRRFELSTEDLVKIVKRMRELKMIPLATPFSTVDLDLVEKLRLPAIKIASPDLVNRPLLAAAVKLNKPFFLSTGASTLDEVAKTAEWMRGWAAEFALLHCVSGYPVPSAQAHLCWIDELARQFDVPVGYSDHTVEVSAGAFAVSAGAAVVEKHVTYDREARGPDHAVSADATQFCRYVKAIREAEVFRGMPGKRVLELEQDVRLVSRQSLVVRRTIQPGETLREEDLTVQRPGTGLAAAEIGKAVGRRVVRALPAGAMLQWDMLEAA